MLELIKSHPWTFGIGVAILVVAVVGVVVGVLTKGRWKDRGLMERGGQKLRWAHAALPIGVQVHESVNDEWLERLFAACRYVNARTSLSLFLLPTRMKDAGQELSKVPGGQVVVMMGSDDDGHCEHRYDLRSGLISAALVSLPMKLLDATSQYLVCLHEMLHVLGLDHDDTQTGSVLSPTLLPKSVLTASDEALLKSTYGI